MSQRSRNVESMSSHGQEPEFGKQRLTREQQDAPTVSSEPSHAPLLGRRRAALDKAARVHERASHNRQEGH